MHTTNLSDCRCPACAGGPLVSDELPLNDAVIVDGAVRCTSCAKNYDVIWGIPFLGHYDADDVLGLIEIAANARADNHYTARDDIARIEGLLAAYHQAPDKEYFIAHATDPYASAPWFQNRYTEYVHFISVAEGVNLQGRQVLDVGAGSGYDAARLAGLGALVTAIEYNPMLAKRGRSIVPEARWFGGFSHVLPFEDASFDVVCCNAALHHMRSIPVALSEMLRVLRPGGFILTSGDPFSSESSGDELEFELFDRHEAVLLGVNESVPKFSEFSRTLIEQRRNIEVKFLTSTLYGFRESAGAEPRNDFDLRWWPFEMHTRLAQAAGTIALRVRLNGRARLAPALQKDWVLRAGDYAKVLTDFEAATTLLAKLLPGKYRDRPFPGETQTKFELLNGWQSPKDDRSQRSAYRRARWFLTRPSGASRLAFQVSKGQPVNGHRLEILVNGHPVNSPIPLADDAWHDVAVVIPPAVAEGECFVLELRMSLDDASGANFADYQFAVRNRRFLTAR